ncbi:MAG: hypothetical protein CMLOHMNK_02123 [Steroidobacteraceae bacterium]|nr:hypothetical protein [Steroidobacteraceae bacterium]
MTRIAASKIFDLLGSQERCVIDRREIADPTFGSVRRCLRQMVYLLRDSDDREAEELSRGLRTLLSEWLTVPVPLDDSIQITIAESFANRSPGAVAQRWGNDMRRLYEGAVTAAAQLSLQESPMRRELAAALKELCDRHQTFKVYCHRRESPHFTSLQSADGVQLVPGCAFLHTVTEYRDSDTFDVLVKCGPLRSHGWGAAPDAVLTAPRFRDLLQVVWAGCSDEPSFGYEPTDPGGRQTESRLKSQWRTRRSAVGQPDAFSAEETVDEVDELQWFRQINRPREMRSATLVELDRDHGILYPPHARVLSFDPDPASTQPFDQRIPYETLTEGMFVVLPVIDEVGLGELRAEHGSYSRVWKEQLRRDWTADPAGLVRRLRAQGLNLVHLESAIERWCEPPSNVIHAPQQSRHFQILIKVLGLGTERHTAGGASAGAVWWQAAWIEVRRSRGEAIQAGVQEREIIDERLLEILKSQLADARQMALCGNGFILPTPDGTDLHGYCSFHRIAGFESGFEVPDSELRKTGEMRYFERWRG